MGLQALLKNATKLLLMGLGGVLGAAVMVWAWANDTWVTISIPSVLVPGSELPLEYEAKVWGVVALAFAGGALSCIWIALYVWVRSMRRERRLARILEQVEEKMKLADELGGVGLDDALALPETTDEPSQQRRLSKLEVLEDDDDDLFLSGSAGLPRAYDDPEDDDLPEDVLEGEEETDREIG